MLQGIFFVKGNWSLWVHNPWDHRLDPRSHLGMKRVPLFWLTGAYEGNLHPKRRESGADSVCWQRAVCPTFKMYSKSPEICHLGFRV